MNPAWERFAGVLTWFQYSVWGRTFSVTWYPIALSAVTATFAITAAIGLSCVQNLQSNPEWGILADQIWVH